MYNLLSLKVNSPKGRSGGITDTTDCDRNSSPPAV
ncbi:Uncharacterised protein [Mycobacteroides abscessus subsp. abscessus]|jgi:hypothetical protein|nr:Uncharacterised protein [Mycobacteroides abscessus subsp. abscessus]